MTSQDVSGSSEGSSKPPEKLRSRSRVIPSIHWFWDFVIAIGLALGIITFVYQPVRVEGTSMSPLLSDQERIFINKFVYKFSSIERGDIVVFQFPRDPRKSFIKRVVALPGEAVEIRDGVLHVNGEVMPELYLSSGDRDESEFPRLRLPTGHYFVLGDQRRSSNDSRTWGTVPRDHIYGKAVFAYWPLDHFGPINGGDGE